MTARCPDPLAEAIKRTEKPFTVHVGPHVIRCFPDGIRHIVETRPLKVGKWEKHNNEWHFVDLNVRTAPGVTVGHLATTENTK